MQRIREPVWTADINVESLEVTLHCMGARGLELHVRLEHPAGPRQLIDLLSLVGRRRTEVELSGRGQTGVEKTVMVVMDDEEAGEAMRLLARAESYVQAMQRAEAEDARREQWWSNMHATARRGMSPPDARAGA